MLRIPIGGPRGTEPYQTNPAGPPPRLPPNAEHSAAAAGGAPSFFRFTPVAASSFDLKPVEGDPFAAPAPSERLDAVPGSPLARQPNPEGSARGGPAQPFDTLRSHTPPAGEPSAVPNFDLAPVQGDPFGGPDLAPYTRPRNAPQSLFERFFGPGATHAVGGAMNELVPDALALPQPGAFQPVGGRDLLTVDAPPLHDPSRWGDEYRVRAWGTNPDLSQFDPAGPPPLEAPTVERLAPPPPPAPVTEALGPPLEPPGPVLPPGMTQDVGELQRRTGELWRNLNAAPVGSDREVVRRSETALEAPKPGSYVADLYGSDVRGPGNASYRALLLASAIPATTPENLSKRIAIIAADVGIPADRFFTDNDGNLKYVDFGGQTHIAAPTVGGGSWTMPIELAQRFMGQYAAQFGEWVPVIAGMFGGMLTGPENYHVAGMAGAAAASSVAEVGRQIIGNKAAERAGYAAPPGASSSPYTDIDWQNVGLTALQNAGYEAFGRMLPPLVNRLFPHWLGGNPYRLSAREMEDMVRLLEWDARNGGTILRRAEVARELKLPATPADLLQTTTGPDGIIPGLHLWGMIQQRLFRSMAELEHAVATAGSSRGTTAAAAMRNYYVWRTREAFPNAVGEVVKRISAEESPTLGFRLFRHAANDVIGHLEQKRLTAGFEGGWRDLFAMPNIRADARPVLAQVNERLSHAAGPVRKTLEELRDELLDPTFATHHGRTTRAQIPITDYQKLHQIRLNLLRQIEDLDAPGMQSAINIELKNELNGIYNTLTTQLRTGNPLYERGDDLFQALTQPMIEGKQGILSLLRDEPRIQERLGGPLADSGPTRIAAARELFREAGKMKEWDAHTRAYLETSLRNARGYESGAAFAAEVAHQPKLRLGLLEMVTDPKTRELLDGLIDLGFAYDQRAKSLALLDRGLQSPSPRRINPRGVPWRQTAANILEPRTNAMRNLREGQRAKDEAHAIERMVDLTRPGKAVYENLKVEPTMAMGGRAGMINERLGYLSAPTAQEGLSDAIPRPTVGWIQRNVLPFLTPPPERDPTAPDITMPERPQTAADYARAYGGPALALPAAAAAAYAWQQWQRGKLLQQLGQIPLPSPGDLLPD